MGAYDAALEAIDEWAECGSIRSALAEEDAATGFVIPSYEWIRTPEEADARPDSERNVAMRTVGDVRVLEQEDIAALRAAADAHFAQAAGRRTSRYTMQYEGNSEVHLDDLCADPALRARMDRALRERVYPLARAAFGDGISASILMWWGNG